MGIAAATLVAAGAAGYVYYSRTAPAARAALAGPQPPVELGVFIRSAENSRGFPETGYYVTVFLNDRGRKDPLEHAIKNIPHVEALDVTSEGYEDIRRTGADFAIRISHHAPGDLEHTDTGNADEQLSITSLYFLIRGKIPDSRARPDMIAAVEKHYADIGADARFAGVLISDVGEFWKVVNDVESLDH
jgi:hypothetical protein